MFDWMMDAMVRGLQIVRDEATYVIVKDIGDDYYIVVDSRATGAAPLLLHKFTTEEIDAARKATLDAQQQEREK